MIFDTVLFGILLIHLFLCILGCLIDELIVVKSKQIHAPISFLLVTLPLLSDIDIVQVQVEETEVPWLNMPVIFEFELGMV